VLALLADENFKSQIQTGLRRRLPTVDLVSVQDLGIRSVNDSDVLARAASENRVLLTHDVNTVPRFAYDRLERGAPMPGVVVVPDQMAIGQAIEELVLLIEGGTDQDVDLRILHLPL
jgi:hypothetical protein